MELLTKDQNGKDQWWFVRVHELLFRDLKRDPDFKLTEEAIFSNISNSNWDAFEFYPLISPTGEETYQYNNVRGHKGDVRGDNGDEFPFIIRGRKLGMLRVRVYYSRKEAKPEMYAEQYSNMTNEWNFTGKQKEFITNTYGPQLKEHMTDENLIKLKRRYISILAKNLLQKCTEMQVTIDYVSKLCKQN